MNQNHLKFICVELELGSVEGVPTSVYGSRGGSFVWRVNTKKASYAIKQLAPVIDLNNERIVNKYELSETIAYEFKQQGIPAIPSLQKSEKHLIIIENTGYLVYPWVEGYTLGQCDVSENHASKIAEMVAKLHCINLNFPNEVPRFDIHSNDTIVAAIDKAVLCQCSFATMLRENQNLILTVNDDYQDAVPLLNEDTVITHGDLDRLNVLWDKAGQPILIDWESARKMNPTREIVRTSLRWSNIGADHISLSRYALMLHKYNKLSGLLNKNHIHAALHGIFGSQINWMLYNIEAACNSDISANKNIGKNEINNVLKEIVKLKTLIPDLLKIAWV